MWNPTIVSASFLFLKTQKNWYRMCAVCLQSTGSPGLARGGFQEDWLLNQIPKMGRVLKAVTGIGKGMENMNTLYSGDLE
jgi:hypothetical protein